MFESIKNLFDSRPIINLDSPIWNETPGFVSEGEPGTRMCALGKLKHTISFGFSKPVFGGYSIYSKLTGYNAKRIYEVNDFIDGRDCKYKAENHWRAIDIMLNDLAASGKVRFKGLMVKDIISKSGIKEQEANEKVCV